MADKSTIYRLKLELADADRGVYQSLNLTAARHPSETAERLAARLLAFGLAWEEGLAFTRGICAGDEPELWRLDPAGDIDLWLEVGQPDAERLVKAARRARRLLIYLYGDRRMWLQNQWPKLEALPRLDAWVLPAALHKELAGRLVRSMEWALTISGGMIYLAVDGTTLEGTLEPLR